MDTAQPTTEPRSAHWPLRSMSSRNFWGTSRLWPDATGYTKLWPPNRPSVTGSKSKYLHKIWIKIYIYIIIYIYTILWYFMIVFLLTSRIDFDCFASIQVRPCWVSGCTYCMWTSETSMVHRTLLGEYGLCRQDQRNMFSGIACSSQLSSQHITTTSICTMIVIVINKITGCSPSAAHPPKFVVVVSVTSGFRLSFALHLKCGFA